jgi:hypothetical protein
MIKQTAKMMEKIRGIWNFSMKLTMGCITRARRNAMVKGRSTGAVTLSTAPAIMQAIKATRKKLALPELKLLKGFFIIGAKPLLKSAGVIPRPSRRIFYQYIEAGYETAQY